MKKDDGDTTNDLLKTWQMNRLKRKEENGWGGISNSELWRWWNYQYESGDTIKKNHRFELKEPNLLILILIKVITLH